MIFNYRISSRLNLNFQSFSSSFICQPTKQAAKIPLFPFLLLSLLFLFELTYFRKAVATHFSIFCVQELGAGMIVGSPPDGKPGFLPVFRSGSCSERGPKQFMEDEHICIDNLVEYLGGTAGFPSPGAFYGVRN